MVPTLTNGNTLLSKFGPYVKTYQTLCKGRSTLEGQYTVEAVNCSCSKQMSN